MELVKGSQVLVTVDPAFRTRGDANTVWVDYANIVHVVPVGGRIYIDDGLISLEVTKIGVDAPPALALRNARTLFLLAPALALHTHYTFPWPPVLRALGIQTPGLTLGWGWTGGLVVSSTEVRPVPIRCGAQAEDQEMNTTWFRSLGGPILVFPLP